MAAFFGQRSGNGAPPRPHWSRVVVLACIVALIALVVWVRREARIATTPMQNADRRMQNAELENAIVGGITPPPSVLDAPGKAKSDDVPIGRSSFIVHHSAFLTVPFVSQAPFRVWSLPYKEYCEEASVLTLHYWKSGQTTPAADQLDRALKEVQAWEEANVGRWEDTTAAEAARILREHFGHANTKVVRGITAEDITRELDAGRPVIVPARGRELDSPYFTPPGPLYHMLVIIGYDDAAQEWITNDVGTNTKGAGQRYTYDDLYDAIGDWNHERGEPTNEKVMIVVE